MGEMRGAATGGSCCTLSGTSQLAAALLNWRKKRQVRSAAPRSNASSSAVIWVFPAGRDRLSHRARVFEHAQATNTGSATSKARGRQAARVTVVAAESHGVKRK